MKTVVFRDEFTLNVVKISLYFITLVALAPHNIGIAATNVTTDCQPFKAIFLWHTNSGEDELFVLQRRILVTTIGKLPKNTSVLIVTFGSENDKTLNLGHHTGHKEFGSPILQYKPGNVTYNAMSYEIIQETISNYLRSNDPVTAEIVYFLVNNKTEINGTENDFEELRKKKKFIISSGFQTSNKLNFWLRLAANERHFVELNRNEDEDILKAAEHILDLSCRDSMFVCDTDMYWRTEIENCYTCTFICSNCCTVQPEFCTQACPYFNKCGTSANTDAFKEQLHVNPDDVACVNAWLFVLIVFVYVVKNLIFVVYKLRDRLSNGMEYLYSRINQF